MSKGNPINREKSFSEENSSHSNSFRRSDIAVAIIFHRPNLFERWALSGCILILLLIVGATWFIRYPEFVDVRIKLYTVNEPKKIIVGSEGRLIKLIVQNNQYLKKGDIIGWIENTTNHKEAISLAEKVDSAIILMESKNYVTMDSLFSEYFSNLGTLQRDYQQFIVGLQEFEDYMLNGSFQEKIKMLEYEVNILDQAQSILINQLDLMKQDLSLDKDTFTLNESLVKLNGLSTSEFLTYLSNIMKKKMTLSQLEISLLSTQAQIQGKYKLIRELKYNASKQIERFKYELQSIKNVLSSWREKYVLVSPINGNVSFVLPLKENQFLRAGKMLGYIDPGDMEFYAETYLPRANIARLNSKLPVKMLLDAYPNHEIGTMSGILTQVSNLPSDSGFLSIIRFSSDMMAHEHGLFLYKSGLTGNARIIINNQRLFTSICQKLILAR